MTVGAEGLKTTPVEQELVQSKVETIKFLLVYNEIRQSALGIRRERKVSRAYCNSIRQIQAFLICRNVTHVGHGTKSPGKLKKKIKKALLGKNNNKFANFRRPVEF